MWRRRRTGCSRGRPARPTRRSRCTSVAPRGPVDLARQIIGEQFQVQPVLAFLAFGHDLQGQAEAGLVRVLQIGGASVRGRDLVPRDRLPDGRRHVDAAEGLPGAELPMGLLRPLVQSPPDLVPSTDKPRRPTGLTPRPGVYGTFALFERTQITGSALACAGAWMPPGPSGSDSRQLAIRWDGNWATARKRHNPVCSQHFQMEPVDAVLLGRLVVSVEGAAADHLADFASHCPRSSSAGP